jgi:hypothetical protein
MRPVRTLLVTSLVLAVVMLLAPSLGARERRTLTIHFPRVSIPAGGNVELCSVFRLPVTTAFDLASVRVRHRGTRSDVSPRHFLVYLYTGEHLAEFANDVGHVVPSRGCLDLGPVDRDHRQLLPSGVPRGLALPLTPALATPGGTPDGIGIVLDAEWVNSSTRARKVSTRVTFVRAAPQDVHRRLTPIYERTAELALAVPPFSVGSTEASSAVLNAARPSEPPLLDAWGAGIATTGAPAPSGDACVVIVAGHMHKRSQFLGVDHVGADGLTANPPGGRANPFEPGRTHLFGTSDYTDTAALLSLPPLLVRAGERLHYGCWIDNGVNRGVRLGCEETAGVTPGTAAGASGAAAKPCSAAGANPLDCPSTDPAFPGRTFTGECVAANAVAGPTPEDEACALTGYYFDAAPGGSCDFTQAP